MSGNDLNRRFKNQDQRLHPEVIAIKSIVKEITYGKKRDESIHGFNLQDEEILAYFDMHGHSRKKNVFVFGNQFSLSSDKYYRTRLIPKLISEETQKFRYHSSQFRFEQDKRNTARILLAQEYNIMNCYTFEASFHGYFDQDR